MRKEVTKGIIIVLIIFIFLFMLFTFKTNPDQIFQKASSMLGNLILKQPLESFIDPMEIRGLQVSQSANDTKISWFTVALTNYTFYYGTSSNNLNETIQNSNFTQYHEVTLTNLTENQIYYYRIFYCNETACRMSPTYNFLRYEVLSGSKCLINQSKILDKKNLLVACDIQITENNSLIINNSNLFFDLENSKILVGEGASLTLQSSYLYADRLPGQKVELENFGITIMNKVTSKNLLYNFKENSSSLINSSSFTINDTINFKEFSINRIENSRPYRINLYASSKTTLVNSYITETYIHATNNLVLSEINGTTMNKTFFSQNFMINLTNSGLGKIFFIAYEGTENVIKNFTLHGFVAKENSKNKIIDSLLYNGNNTIIFEKSKTEITQSRCYLTNINFSTILINATLIYNKPGSIACTLYTIDEKSKIEGYVYIPKIILSENSSLERFYPIKVMFNNSPIENVTVMIKKNEEIISSGKTDSRGEVSLNITFTNSSVSDDYWIVIGNRKYQKLTLLTDTRNEIVLEKNDLPEVKLNSPENNFSTKSYTINFSCNASDDIGLKSLSLYVNDSKWRPIRSISCSGNSCTLNYSANFPPASYEWNCLAYDIKNLASFAEKNFTFAILNDPPNITLNWPPNNYITNSTNISFNCSAIDDKKVNLLSLHGDFPDGNWKEIKRIYCNASQCTLVHEENLSYGRYSWNCFALDNDSASSWNPFHHRLQITNESYVLLLNFVPPTPPNGSILETQWIYVRVNTSNNIESCELELDGTFRYNMIKQETDGTNNFYEKNITNLTVGKHRYIAYGKDLLNNTNSSEERFVEIKETVKSKGGGAESASKECITGQKRCYNNILQECVAETWKDLEKCTDGCDEINLICQKAVPCTEGAKRCLENKLQECKNKEWVTIEECAYGCNSELQNCNQAQKKCSARGIEQNINGEWVLVQECAYGCDEKTLSCITISFEKEKPQINVKEYLTYLKQKERNIIVAAIIAIIIFVLTLHFLSSKKKKTRRFLVRTKF